MTDFSDIKKRWLRDPEVRAEYDAIEEEFALARELILARSRAGLSQAEVARRMGTTQSTVARLESGRSKPTLQSVERYANATGTRAVVQLVGARGDVNMPSSTRDLRETVMARAQRDAAYRAALLTEAVEALLQGEADLSKGILRDLVNATLGFDALAEAIGLPAKSLHRMLGAAGNPTLSNLSAILRAVQDHEGLELHVHATTRGTRARQG